MTADSNKATEAALAPKAVQGASVATSNTAILDRIAGHAKDPSESRAASPGSARHPRSHAASQPNRRTPLLPKGTLITKAESRHRGDPKKASVCVSIHEARDMSQGCGRFVKVKLGKAEERTPTSMPDGSNGSGSRPEWHRHFWFVDLAAPEDATVDLQVFEVRMGKSERAGEVSFPLRSFMHGKIVDKWYPVMNFGGEQSEASGQVRVRVHYRKPEIPMDEGGFLASVKGVGKRSWITALFCCGCSSVREEQDQQGGGDGGDKAKTAAGAASAKAK